jgi:hypothetical protein
MDEKGNMDEKGTRSGDAEMIGADAHETERTCGFYHNGKSIDNVNVASSKSSKNAKVATMVVVEDTALPLAPDWTKTSHGAGIPHGNVPEEGQYTVQMIAAVGVDDSVIETPMSVAPQSATGTNMGGITERDVHGPNSVNNELAFLGTAKGKILVTGLIFLVAASVVGGICGTGNCHRSSSLLVSTMDVPTLPSQEEMAKAFFTSTEELYQAVDDYLNAAATGMATSMTQAAIMYGYPIGNLGCFSYH